MFFFIMKQSKLFSLIYIQKLNHIVFSYFVRRKKICVSSKTRSIYAKVEIKRSEDSTYQQLNVSGLEKENANQQQDISDVEQNNT